MRIIISISLIIVLLTACLPEPTYTTDSAVGNWKLTIQEDRENKKKDCPTQIELRENETVTLIEKNGEKREGDYYIQHNGRTDDELVLFQEEERGDIRFLKEEYIELRFSGRGVTCGYDKIK